MKTGGVLDRLIKSFDLTDEGFSFRKIMSLIVLILVVYIHIKFVDATNALNFTLYDFGFICVLLGLVNVDNFIAAKWGGKESPEPVVPAPAPAPVVAPPAVDNPDA